MRAGRDVEEVAGMDEDLVLFEEVECERFLAVGIRSGGEAENGGPAPFGTERRDEGVGGGGGRERLVVRSNAGLDLPGDGGAGGQEMCGGELDGGGD